MSDDRLIDLLEADRVARRRSKRCHWMKLGIPQTTYYRWLKGQRPTTHWDKSVRERMGRQPALVVHPIHQETPTELEEITP